MIIVIILVLLSGFSILHNLRNTGSVLIDAGRELETLAQDLGNQLQQNSLPRSYRQISKLDQHRDESLTPSKQDDDTHELGLASKGKEGYKKNTLSKLKDYLTINRAKNAAGGKHEEFTASLITNPDLKRQILDLTGTTDQSISLPDLVKQLPKRYFDGNYHPVLNELDQLEREREIECQVINGRMFVKKKPKDTRKYIIRKGRNFRKHMG